MVGGQLSPRSCHFLLFCYFLQCVTANYDKPYSPLLKSTLNDSVNNLQLPLNQLYNPEGLLSVGPRGGHFEIRCRLQRVRYLPRRVRYSSNGLSTYHPSVYRILCSGDVEINPGYKSAENSPLSNSTQGQVKKYKHPCKICCKSVRCNQKGILCDSCDLWFHCRCIGMKNEIYQALASSDEEWLCCDCALPQFTDSFFSETSEGNVSVDSEVLPTSPNTAAKRVVASNTLRCLLINARSLRNIVLDLQALLIEKHTPIVAITETWLDAGFMDFELGMKDYSINRKDRQNRRGGGVLLAVHRNLIAIRRSDLEIDDAEIVMVEICQKSKDSVLFGVCYRPPNAKMEYSLILRRCLERIDATRFSTCYLVGDFNFPCIDWHTISPTSTDALTLDFCSMLNDHFLVQCNHIPTRSSNGIANILDLILTRTPQSISNIEVFPDHFDSDHLPVAFNIRLQSGRPHNSAPRRVYNYKKANFTELIELLTYVPWNCAFLEDDVDCCADNVKDLLLTAADMCIPHFKLKRKTNPP